MRLNFKVFYEQVVDPRSKLKTKYQLATYLETVMSVYKKNSQHAHQFQKYSHDKIAKSKSYTPKVKVGLNNKYIKTKQNRKLEFKFYDSFRILYKVGKQTYKLELLKR